MDWLEITVTVSVKDLDAVTAIAHMTVPYGIYIEDYSDLESGSFEVAHVDLIDETLLKKDRSVCCVHLYVPKGETVSEACAYLTESLTAAHIPYTLSQADVEKIDWNEYWKQFFHTTEIGERLVVQPIWETYDNRENRTILKMDPGAAFGTGTHATTALCLEALESYVKPGMSVLDIGCGSGILGITGVLLGCDRCVGVDIDAAAVRVSVRNAQLNCVSDRCTFVQGDLTNCINGTFDIVCANLVADAVIRLLQTVHSYMNDGGLLLASGIIDSRADDVHKALRHNGYIIETELTREHWYAMMIRKEGVSTNA